MQSLARENIRIKIDKAEVEAKPGAGVTIQKPFSKYEEEKKGNLQSGQPVRNDRDSLYNLFLAHLLRPREWTAQNDGNGYFSFRREHIITLTEECQRVIMEQPMVLRVDAPIKVFGDIHG